MKLSTNLSLVIYWITPCFGKKSKPSLLIQSTLGFATMGLAAALGLATATPLTDLRQYINSDLGFSDLEI